MRGSSREEEGKGRVANEFINACEEEDAKHVRDDTVQVRSERKEGRKKEGKPCVKAKKSEKSKTRLD